jgi:hypothetical protein
LLFGRQTVRSYSSFVVRRWRLGAAVERVTVEHVQSGKRTTVDGLPQALAWMTAVDTAEAGGDGPTTDIRERGNASE